ncbi:hypothetical protein DI005_30065 [Prauserella sp. PE36]|nr:hypothetical protein DI005_30065 [Prauserella sp. PE36]
MARHRHSLRQARRRLPRRHRPPRDHPMASAIRRHDLGETLTQAAVREVREETGIECEVTGLIGIYSNPNHVIAYDDGEVRQEFSICFRAKPFGGQLRTSSESKEVHWVTPEKLDGLRLHPSIGLRIDHALKQGNVPFFS